MPSADRDRRRSHAAVRRSRWGRRFVARPEAALALFWLAFATIAAVRFPWHGLWHDDAVYIALGRALAAGDYVLTQLPGSPAETRYPPLHPAVLALCWWLSASAERPFVFALPGLVVAALGIVVWGVVLQHHLRLRAAVRTTALALAVFAPGWLQVVQCAMAEPWVFTLLPVALLLLGRTGRGRALAAGVVIGLAALAKSIALVTLLVLAAQLLLQRRWRASLLLVVGGALVQLPWWWHVAQHGAPSSSVIVRYYQGYSGLLCHDLATFVELLPERVRDLSCGTVRQAAAGLFTPEVWPALAASVRTAIVVATGVGAVVLLLAGSWRALRGCLVTGAALALWLVSLAVVDVSWRYVMPALPVVFALLLRATGRHWWLAAALFAALSLPASFVLLQLEPAQNARMWREDVPVAGYAEAAAAVRSLPTDAIVATEVDSWLHLVTGRRAVMPSPVVEHTPCARDSDAFELLCRGEWRRLGVTHALLDPRTGKREREVLLAAWRSGEFTFVEASLPRGFVLLQRR